jgi:hypothetical protein
MTHPLDGPWHVAAVLRGNGRRVYRDERDFVFYVQRYVTPQPGRKYTGDTSCRSWDTEAEAQRAADNANAFPSPDFPIRGTYL